MYVVVSAMSVQPHLFGPDMNLSVSWPMGIILAKQGAGYFAVATYRRSGDM